MAALKLSRFVSQPKNPTSCARYHPSPSVVPSTVDLVFNFPRISTQRTSGAIIARSPTRVGRRTTHGILNAGVNTGAQLFATLCRIGSTQVTCGLWVSSSHGVSTMTKLNCTVSMAKFMRRAKFCSVPVKNAFRVETRDGAKPSTGTAKGQNTPD